MLPPFFIFFVSKVQKRLAMQHRLMYNSRTSPD